MASKVSLLRKGSLGVEGTERNAKHHAKKILPFIAGLKPWMRNLGFAEWVQGHNVHKLITKDGRVFVLRPIWTEEDGYCGVKVLAAVSRREEIPLIALMDSSEEKLDEFTNALELLAKPVPPKHAANSKEF